MPFKIVQTFEKGANQLFTVPSGWEWKGHLRYPKKTNECLLVEDENSKPRADWRIMSCKVKRTGFLTYNDAEQELSSMMQHSDTDTGGVLEETRKGSQLATSVIPDFNNEAEQLILNAQSNFISKPSDAIAQNVPRTQDAPLSEQTIWFINDTNHQIMTSSDPVSVLPQPIDINTQKLDIIIENQKKIMEIQNKFSHRFSNFIIEIESTIEKTITRTINRHLGQPVVTLGDVANSAENSNFKIKPINKIEELENLELLLLDPAEKNKMMKLYSVVCTPAEGHGITCAYQLIDLLFTREFLCKCSWSGGSRGNTIKLPLKKYQNILDFCFRLIYSWDKTYTIEDNENFFKLVLRNASQRNKLKNLRKPSMRKRSNKVNKQETQTRRDSNMGNEKNIEKRVGEEMEEEKKENMQEEIEENKVREIDVEQEERENMEEGVEEDITREMDMEEEERDEIEEAVQEDIAREIDMEEEMDEEILNVINVKKEKRQLKEIEEDAKMAKDKEKAVKKERIGQINIEEYMGKEKLDVMCTKENKKERKKAKRKKLNPMAIKNINSINNNYHLGPLPKKPKLM